MAIVDSLMAMERAVERRVVTILFCDLVGFTSLSEELDAEDVTLVQDAYFDAVRETVARHGGQLEKFVGDAAMAVFGAPRVRDDDAERAVRAGLALVAAVQRVGAGLGLAPGALRLRVGVTSGETVYGEASAERGAVTGDVVNVAARLQAAGEPETVTVGEATALAVADAIELERLPPFELKGKAELVPAWRAVGVHAERSRERALGGLRAPTLGRDDEVAHLRSLLGSTARVTVVAPPGVGKTRLLDELAVVATGAAVLRARLRPDVLSPFEPVAQLVGGMRTPTELVALARAAGATEARAAVVAELLGGVGSAEVHPAAEREQLFAAWLEGLDAIAGERASVWLVEDVHWASPDLLAFLELAGSSPRSAGRLVVASTRPVLLDERPEWVERGERLDLPLLPPRETEELVRELVGEALPAELVARVAERSAGNPLFVEELLRTWAAVGILAADEAGWRLAAPAEEVELPLTVQAIYAAQLDDLPPPARAAARRAAVAGRRFPRAALALFEVEEPDAALDTLVRRSLVSSAEEDVLLGPSHSYRHALLRDAGYASLARAERARLHVRLADWLAEKPEQSRPALAEVVGRHYAAALDAAPALGRDVGGLERDELRKRAAEWFETASRVALGFAAWASARDLAARALELSDEEGLERARRLHLLGDATARAVGVDEARPLLEESLDVYRDAGADAARDGIVDGACSLGRLLYAQTQFSLVEQLADGLLLELGERDDAATAKLLALRGSAVLAARDDFDGARGDGERALALARRAGDADAELEALQLVTSCTEGDDELEGQRWAEIESLARARGRWQLVAGAVRAQVGAFVGDEPARALSEVERAAELAEARGLVDEMAWVDYDRTEAHLVAGSWDDAIEVGLRAIEAAESRALFRIAVRTWFALRPIARARGRMDLIERAFPVFEEVRGSSQSPYARVIVGAMELAFADAGLLPPFVPELEPRLTSFELGYGDPSWLAALEAIVGSWLAAGALADARTALDRLRASNVSRRTSRLARASHALMWSRLLLAEGGAAAAAAEAERALDTEAPWWRAQALRALVATGGGTAETLAEAAALERSLGIEPSP
jgi:class 3 adenylate cyclase